MRALPPAPAPAASTAAVRPPPTIRSRAAAAAAATLLALTPPALAVDLDASAAATLLAFAPPALAADVGASAALFTKTCAGCHAGGGNVVAPGQTLFPEALARGGVDSRESLYTLIYGGRGRMPGYGEKCEPKGACTFGARLSDGEIEGLAAYVLQRAAEGWK